MATATIDAIARETKNYIPLQDAVTMNYLKLMVVMRDNKRFSTQKTLDKC